MRYFICEFTKCKFINPFLYRKGEVLILHQEVKDSLLEKNLIKVNGKIKTIKIKI